MSVINSCIISINMLNNRRFLDLEKIYLFCTLPFFFSSNEINADCLNILFIYLCLSCCFVLYIFSLETDGDMSILIYFGPLCYSGSG